jgi:hypothetical protein
LISEARITLEAIQSLAGQGVDDPLADPLTLTKAVTVGVLDAPQLMNNSFGRGMIRTRIVEGACEAVDESGRVLSERERLSQLV